MDRSAEVNEHTSFDRRNSAYARLPTTTQKKFLASYRTAYTTLVCIVLTQSWKLGGSATYVAPLLSAISGGSAYFGQWQNDAWKVTYAAICGSALGALIGFSWQYNYFQIILLFVVLTWANRISLWDRLGKVIAAIGIVLGALWPKLSLGKIIGLEPFQYTVLIVLVPYTITGLTLLFPRLTLASYAAQEKVSKINTTLNSAVSALVRGFCAADYADLYTSEIDHLLVQLEKDVSELVVLKSFVESEALVFHKLEFFGPALGDFIKIVLLIMDEISSVRDNLDVLLHNRTQAKFVEILRPILGNLGADIEIVICIADEHLTSNFNIRIYPDFVYQAWASLTYGGGCLFDCLLHCKLSGNNTSSASTSTSSSSPDNRASISQRMSRKDSSDENNQATASRYFDSSSRSIKMKSMYDRRKFFRGSLSVPEEDEEKLFCPDSIHHDEKEDECHVEAAIPRQKNQESEGNETICRKKELKQTIQRLRASQVEMIDLYRKARAQYVWHSTYATGTETTGGTSAEEEEVTAAAVFAETKLLSFRNLGPRAAILHRTSLLTELICSLDSVLNTDTADKRARMTYMSTMMSFSKRAIWTIIIYLKESFLAYVSNSTYIVTVMIPALLCGGINSICRKSSSSSTLPTSMPMAPFQDITGSQSFSTIVTETDSDTSKNMAVTSSIPGTTRMKSVKEVVKVMKKTLLDIRNVYAQPAKIALAVTITSFFVLLEQLQSRAKNSLWAVLVVVLVRQESTSSSFLTGYQRLEGTVVGAVYAFTMYQIFGCDTNQCGSNVSTPVLVFWLALCSFFRDGPRHGYAAIVAGFTPIVLFLGNTPSTAAGAWERVELTFTGIGIYLLIDNLIFPNRTDVALRAGVLKSIEVTSEVVCSSFSAVRILMTVGTDAMGKPVVLTKDDDAIMELYSAFTGYISPGGITKNSSVTLKDYKSNKNKNEDENENNNEHEKQNGKENDEENENVSLETRAKRLSLLIFPRDRDDVLLNFKEKVEQCSAHLVTCAKQVAILKELILKDLLNLSLVVHEPELWQRSFPADVYKPLLTCFTNVMKSTRSVASATKSFSGVLQDMVSRGESAQVALHLCTYSFMTQHLLAVSNKTDLALHLATDRVAARKRGELHTDLTAIVTLSRGCEALQQKVDDYYRQTYSKLDLDFLAKLNPNFLVAFQDVYHSVAAATKTLSQLGIALRAVRDVEALSAL